MDIFTLTDEDGCLFSPVRQASIFAKYSRSPDSARDLVRKTDETSAERFQQKWIVKFGHNAIAELATIPVAFEGVSIIASKIIEKWQRPGVCEKSTRMQQFSRDSLLVPDGIEPQFRQAALHAVDQAFTLYQRILDELPTIMTKKLPDATEFQVGRAVFDIARYLLPAGCRTNLGICAYPRDIAEMIAETSGSSNPEFREIGANLKAATEDIGGPLIRHTEPDEWVQQFPLVPSQAPLQLQDNTVFLTSVESSDEAFKKLLQTRYGMTLEKLDRLMAERPEYHAVPHLFREARFSYSIYMDYGAFRDLQRHRRLDQFVEPLTPLHGFSTPPGLEGELLKEYQRVLGLFEALPWSKEPQQALLCQYLVPLAFRVGWHIKLDLQQLYYLVELRTRPAGHISYRKVAHEMLTEAKKLFPTLTQWVRATKPV